MNVPDIEIFVPQLLSAWQAKGNMLGIHQHLQLQKLLENIPTDTPLPRLKSFLAPLLTDSELSQNEFYELFDDALLLFEKRITQHETAVQALQTQHQRQEKRQAFNEKLESTVFYKWYVSAKKMPQIWQYIASGLLILLLGLGIWTGMEMYEAYQKKNAYVPKDLGEQKIFIQPNIQNPDFQSIQLILEEQDPDLQITFEGKEKLEHVAVKETFSNGNLILSYKGLTKGRDILKYKYTYSNKDYFYLVAHFVTGKYGRVVTKPILSEGNFQIKTQKDTSTFENAPIADNLSTVNTEMDSSFMTMNSSQAINGVTSTIRFGSGITPLTPQKGLFVGSFAILLLLLTLWWKRRKQRFSINSQHPPSALNDWNISIPHLKNIDFGKNFHQILTAMLRRVDSHYTQLDMKRTIKESIQQGGAVTFQYENLTQYQDYLVLIDANETEAFSTKLFQQQIKELQANDAPILSFYFDIDQQMVWNERHPKGLTIQQLQHKFGECQLLFFTDGEELFDENQELNHWTTVFESWRKRALLTPHPVEEWGKQEAQLANQFRLLPDTPNGWSVLMETLETIDPKPYLALDIEKIRNEDYSRIIIPENLDAEALEIFLEQHLIIPSKGKNQPPNDILFRWLAALALPPNLYWDWMILAGQTIDKGNENPLTIEHLTQLNRLSWIRDSAISEQGRLVLLFWLEKNYPNLLDQLHVVWGNVLNIRENQPPVGSLAWQGYRIQVILNQLLQKPNAEKRAKLEKELEELVNRDYQKDALVIKYMEQRTSPLDAMLSNRFRPLVQERDPIFWQWKSWTWQMPVVILVLFLTLLTNYNEPVTTFQFDEYITELAFTKDSKAFIVANGAGNVSMCSVEGNFLQGTTGRRNQIVGLETSQDGNLILTGTGGNTFSYWDVSGAPIFKLKGDDRVATSISYHPNKPYWALIGYYGNEASVWNLETKEKLTTVKHKNAVMAVAFSKDGKYIATGGKDNLVKIWTAEGTLIKEINGFADHIHSIDFSPDNQLIVVGSRDNSAYVFDLVGEQKLKIDKHKHDVYHVAFSPNGQQILTTTIDKAMLWNLKGKRLRTFSGHYGYLKTGAFSPDGRFIVTGDAYGKVNLYRNASE